MLIGDQMHCARSSYATGARAPRVPNESATHRRCVRAGLAAKV